MLISANELAALLKRVFEGLGYPQGQYEDAAAMAGWLPLHGEDGLDALAWQADPALPATELSAPAPGRLVARCHGRSALDALPSLLDLACLRASRQGRIQLEILDCRDRKCVLAAGGLRPQGLLGPGAMGRRCASASPHRLDRKRRRLSELPDGGPAGTRRCGIATLLTLTLDIEPLPAPVLEADAARIARRVTPADYAQAGRRALEHGTEVSPTLWQRLNRLAEAVLVENSEQSRSGAGGR